MGIRVEKVDWSLLQAFVAVAEEGSLSAGALKLGISQPTLGRQIKTAEQSLGGALFSRHARGLNLTEFGLSILASARDMSTAAAKVTLVADGLSEEVSGIVRISASTVVSHFVMPEIISKIRVEEPQIEIELAPSDTTENLLFREADIAVRMYRPEQLDVITMHVGDAALGLFAAKSYLERRGTPETMDDFKDHDVIGYDRSNQIIDGMKELGMPVTRDFFKTRCDDQAAYWHLVRAGCGIGAGQLTVGLDDNSVKRVLPQLDLPSLPYWLTAHEALRNTPQNPKSLGYLGQGI